MICRNKYEMNTPKGIEDNHQENELLHLIEQAPDPMVLAEETGYIRYANRLAKELFGYVDSEMVGIPLQSLIFPEAGDYPFRFPDHFQTGLECLGQRLKGDKFRISVSSSFIVGEQGDLVWISVRERSGMLDSDGTHEIIQEYVATQQAHEKKIEILTEELGQRILELESFSYSVSHDLRAPLRGINGFFAIFIRKYFDKVDNEGQRLIGKVRENVDKMETLLDEILTLSRVGMDEIRLVHIDMNNLIDTILNELNLTSENIKITIGDLGKAVGDIALIKQVFVNILINAIKFTDKQDRPEIEIGSRIVGDERHYYVKDNGVGFDMAYVHKLFGVFQRLHDPMEYEGVGVGLAIVKRIVIRHGGKVWAKGKENEGSTIYFSLKTN